MVFLLLALFQTGATGLEGRGHLAGPVNELVKSIRHLLCDQFKVEKGSFSFREVFEGVCFAPKGEFNSKQESPPVFDLFVGKNIQEGFEGSSSLNS